MIFVDSSYLIARLITNDKYHERAIELENELSERRVINNTVLNETLNAFTKSGGTSVKELLDKLTNIHEVAYLSSNDYEQAADLFKYYDSSINFSDCTILQSMHKFGINKIVSFDDDFSKVKGLSIIK